MSEHVPTPWIWVAADRGSQDPETGIWEDAPSPACVMAGDDDDDFDEDKVIAWMNSSASEDEQERNAEFIALACNEHGQVRDLRDAIRLMIGRDSRVPWNEVAESEVDAYIATIRRLKATQETRKDA